MVAPRSHFLFLLLHHRVIFFQPPPPLSLTLSSGERGAGGEYLPQEGFGWTNGAVLHFLDVHGGDALVSALAQ